MRRDNHKYATGLKRIMKIAFTMNPGGKRRYTQNNITDSLDEDIVSAPRNRGMEHEVPTRTNSVMTEQLSRRLARWKYSTGEDAGYLQLDEKTPEALLQLDIAYRFWLRSVDGRLWSPDFGWDGVAPETPFCFDLYANPRGKNAKGHYLVGSFSGALSSRTRSDSFPQAMAPPASLIHLRNKKI